MIPFLGKVITKGAGSWVAPLTIRFFKASFVGFTLGIMPRMVAALIELGKRPEEIPASRQEVQDLHAELSALRSDLAHKEFDKSS